MHHAIIVIGTSYGGLNALEKVLSYLPEDFAAPLAIVQHRAADADTYLSSHLEKTCRIRVKEADDKELLSPGCAYIAPPDYHLMVEDDMTLSLSIEQKVNFSRPSIDVLFESAAYSLGKKVVGVVLTGANTDGSIGLKKIKAHGGFTIVQSPESSEADAMTRGAIEASPVDRILHLDRIGRYLTELFSP